MKQKNILCLVILLLLIVLVKNTMETFTTTTQSVYSRLYSRLRNASNASVSRGSDCYIYDKLMEDRFRGTEIPKTCSSASSLTNISDACKKKYCLAINDKCTYSSGKCSHPCEAINTGSGTQASKKTSCEARTDCNYDTGEPDNNKKCKQKLLNRKPVLYQSNSLRASERCETVNAICEGDADCNKRSCVSEFCKISDNKCVLKDSNEITYINDSLGGSTSNLLGTYTGDSGLRGVNYGSGSSQTSGSGVADFDYSGVSRPSQDFRYNSMANFNSDFNLEDMMRFYSSKKNNSRSLSNSTGTSDYTSSEYDYGDLSTTNSRQNIVLNRERNDVGSSIVQSDIKGVGNIFAPEIIIR